MTIIYKCLLLHIISKLCTRKILINYSPSVSEMDAGDIRVTQLENRLRSCEMQLEVMAARINALEGAARMARGKRGDKGDKGDKGYFAQFVNNCLQSYKGHTTVWGVLAASGGSTCSGVS